MRYMRAVYLDHVACLVKLCSEGHGLNASWSRSVQDLYACHSVLPFDNHDSCRRSHVKALKLFDMFSIQSPHLTASQETDGYYCSIHLDLSFQLDVPIAHHGGV